MKKLLCMLLTLALLAGCAAPAVPTTEPQTGEVLIRLSDEGIEYPADSGIQTAEEAEHTVVRITQPGTYRVTGSITAGQLAVDLGENAKDDPDATVLLILDNAEITCRTAPAVIFYNVWESGVPNGLAGAHVLLANGSKNRIVGANTEDYDGAFYSRMSMKLDGAGSLRIEGGNEGLCSELHLTINGGDISISSGNDGINTNADGVSVTTINDGRLWIAAGGDEGDGIDSNGSVVINGGYIEAYACADSMDSGIDADLGIQINGGTVIATGNMLDPIDEGGQTFAVFSFAQSQKAPYFTLKDMYASTVLEGQTPSAFTNLLFSSPELSEGTYTLWAGDTQFEGQTSLGGGNFGFIGGEPIQRPDFPGKGEGGDVEIPPQPTVPIVTHGTIQPPPEGDRPADMPVAQFPDGAENMPVPPELPEGAENMPIPQLPEGATPPKEAFDRQPIEGITGVLSTDFAMVEGANYFMNVRAVTE